jgi:hypothetical protein
MIDYVWLRVYTSNSRKGKGGAGGGKHGARGKIFRTAHARGKNEQRKVCVVEKKADKAVQEKHMSSGAKEILIKSVAQAIPTYAMGVFELPATLCEEMTQMIRYFW